jgi:hypothetical protein
VRDEVKGDMAILQAQLLDDKRHVALKYRDKNRVHVWDLLQVLAFTVY